MFLSKKDLVISSFIAAAYLLLTIFLMNFALAKDTLLGGYPLAYKVNITFSLILGMWTSMTHQTIFLLILIAFLSGLNLTLLAQKISLLKYAKSLQFTVGGGTILGIAGAGCASCGLPFLSLLGVSSSFLPFKGEEFLYISLILLLVSVYLLFKSNAQLSCNVRPKGNGKIFTFSK